MSYTAEGIPTTIIKDLLDTNWADAEGNIIKPELKEATSTESRIDLSLENKDVIVIRVEDSGLQEKWRSNYSYADLDVPIRLEVYTQNSRQRLYDLMQECRRIIRAQKHNVEGYQLLRYVNFIELTNEQLNVWMGIIRINLESRGIAI